MARCMHLFLFPDLTLYQMAKLIYVIKLKAFAEDKLNVANMTIYVFDRVENTLGKRRKCRLQAFSPFPTLFCKAFFFRVIKSRDCVVKN